MSAQAYVVLVDDSPVDFDHPEVTGQEIISRVEATAQGLVELMTDGSQRQVVPNELFDLASPRNFKKPPHFKRG